MRVNAWLPAWFYRHFLPLCLKILSTIGELEMNDSIQTGHLCKQKVDYD